MAFANDPAFLDGLTYSALEVRLMDALMLQANGSAGGAVSGIRPGDPGLAVSVAGSTITVTAGVAAVFYPAFGLYRACSSSSTTLTLSAADPTNPRIDLVYLRVWDNAVDGAGLSKADTVYLAGTPAVSPVAPTPTAPVVYIPLATISVPKVGGGSASASAAIRPVTVAPGGISPSGTAAGTYAGQYRDGNGYLERYSGSAWQSRIPMSASGTVDFGGSGGTSPLALLLSGASNDLLNSRVGADTFNRFTISADGKLGYGGGSAAQDGFFARTGVGQFTLTGSLAATAMAPTIVEDTTAGRTTTSLTYVAVNAMAATIVVPASGRVRVDLRVTARNSSSSLSSLTIFNASGSTTGTVYTGVDAAAFGVAATTDMQGAVMRMLAGMVPGETLTVTPVHRVSAASTMTIDYRYLLLTPQL